MQLHSNREVHPDVFHVYLFSICPMVLSSQFPACESALAPQGSIASNHLNCCNCWTQVPFKVFCIVWQPFYATLDRFYRLLNKNQSCASPTKEFALLSLGHHIATFLLGCETSGLQVCRQTDLDSSRFLGEKNTPSQNQVQLQRTFSSFSYQASGCNTV